MNQKMNGILSLNSAEIKSGAATSLLQSGRTEVNHEEGGFALLLAMHSADYHSPQEEQPQNIKASSGMNQTGNQNEPVEKNIDEDNRTPEVSEEERESVREYKENKLNTAGSGNPQKTVAEDDAQVLFAAIKGMDLPKHEIRFALSVQEESAYRITARGQEKTGSFAEILLKGLDTEKWKITKSERQPESREAAPLKNPDAKSGSAEALKKEIQNQTALTHEKPLETAKRNLTASGKNQQEKNALAAAESTDHSRNIRIQNREENENIKNINKNNLLNTDSSVDKEKLPSVTDSGQNGQGGNFRENAQGQERRIRITEAPRIVSEGQNDKTSLISGEAVRKENPLTESPRSFPAAERTANASPEITEMMNRLAVKARINIASDGSSTASIRMHPENLGFMTLNIKVSEGRAEGRILVENQTAMKLIKDEMETLRNELRNQGITLDSFTVRVREMTPAQSGEFSESGRNGQFSSSFGHNGDPQQSGKNPRSPQDTMHNINDIAKSADRNTVSASDDIYYLNSDPAGFEISL